MTRWALPVVLVCCAIGGLVGWSSTVPVYRSVAILDFSPRASAEDGGFDDGCVLYEFPPGVAVPAFDARLESAVVVLRNPRPHNHPALAALGLSPVELMAGLTVTRVKRTPLISVAFEHTDRGVPAPVINAVIALYDDRMREGETSSNELRLKAIDAQIEALELTPKNSVTKKQLELLLARKRQLEVEAGDRSPHVASHRVVTYAETPSAPARDQRPLFASLGALLGGVLAAGAFWVQSRAASSVIEENA